MSIYATKKTRLICQGLTGTQASIHCASCIEYGTKLVAGVTPYKGGITHLGVPIYNTVHEAKKYTAANTSIIFVPPNSAADAILEAIDAKIEMIICITRGIPIHDMIKIKKALSLSKTILIGPNSSGIISPSECKIGIMPNEIYKKGRVGIISKSGTLSYEAALQTTQNGLGQSTCINIGGDEIIGTNFVNYIDMFLKDKSTDAILIIGEIVGRLEYEVANFIKSSKIKKPIFVFIPGVTAPKRKKMGHAGSIISILDSAEEKLDKLESSGAIIIKSVTDIGSTILNLLK